MVSGNELFVRRKGRFAVIHLEERLGATEVDQLKVALEDLLRERGIVIILDFTLTEFISSRGIGVLMAARSELSRRKGRMILANIQPSILRIFQLTRVDTMFELTDSYSHMMELETAEAQDAS